MISDYVINDSTKPTRKLELAPFANVFKGIHEDLAALDDAPLRAPLSFCQSDRGQFLRDVDAAVQKIAMHFLYSLPCLLFDGHFILTVRKTSQSICRDSPNEPLTDAMALFFVRLAGERPIRLAPPCQDQKSSLGAQRAGGQP